MFNYDLNLLSSCALHDNASSCHQLFDLHSIHYGYVGDGVAGRYNAFVENARWVYNHNYDSKEQTFRIELNQFSHLMPYELRDLFGDEFVEALDRTGVHIGTEDITNYEHDEVHNLLVPNDKQASNFAEESSSIEFGISSSKFKSFENRTSEKIEEIKEVIKQVWRWVQNFTNNDDHWFDDDYRFDDDDDDEYRFGDDDNDNDIDDDRIYNSIALYDKQASDVSEESSSIELGISLPELKSSENKTVEKIKGILEKVLHRIQNLTDVDDDWVQNLTDVDDDSDDDWFLTFIDDDGNGDVESEDEDGDDGDKDDDDDGLYNFIELNDKQAIEVAEESYSIDWGMYSSKLRSFEEKTSKKIKKVLKKIRKMGNDLYSGHVYLNWATTANPDGVAIVQPPTNQLHCGSCWAITSSRATFSNAVRNTGFSAFTQTVINLMDRNDFNISDDKQVNKVIETAKDRAQYVEKHAVQLPTLSVQELIDCDTQHEMGCIGGNPLTALSFIHSNGLTSNDEYPYIGLQQICQEDKLHNPIVTLDAYGVLPTDAENFMAEAVESVGPIAVGFSVTDPSFLYYKGGIYESSICTQGLNHALLLVGYGEEVVGNTTQRYWIAQNSWGESWGENGYVRIARSNLNGLRTGQSVCGLAIEPSVAVGAHFVPEVLENSNLSPLNTSSSVDGAEKEDKDNLDFPEKIIPSKFLEVIIGAAFTLALIAGIFRVFTQRREEDMYERKPILTAASGNCYGALLESEV